MCIAGFQASVPQHHSRGHYFERGHGRQHALVEGKPQLLVVAPSFVLHAAHYIQGTWEQTLK